MLKVGMPRALLFYEFYPFWKTFFEELGAKLIISDSTTKSILDDGVRVCIDEACLPLKVFHGHVNNLKGKVDCIFIPRLTSIAEGEYICPKFGGLPDMIKSSIEDLPKIISTEINVRDSIETIFNSIKEIGKHFCPSTRKIIRAYKKAVEAYENNSYPIRAEIPERMNGKKLKIHAGLNVNYLNVAVLGHPYNIYDSYVNMNIIKKLEDNAVNSITLEMLNEDEIDSFGLSLPKKMFWTFGRRIIGAAMCFLERKDIHGIIYIMSFGCGLDSFICDMVERRARKEGIPFTIFVLDEHTGEAGVDTRVEAFIDMIKWRSKNDNNVSTYG